MRAIQFTAVNQLALAVVPAPVPAPGEVVVALRAAALNHRDLWIKLGQYAGLKFPCIPGSDGTGVVESVGVGADAAWVGREVIINPSFGWGADARAQGEWPDKIATVEQAAPRKFVIQEIGRAGGAGGGHQ